MKKFLLIMAFSLMACLSSQATSSSVPIETAVPATLQALSLTQTAAVPPANSNTPQPTNAPRSTITPIPPTETSTTEPSPTPDTRLIIGDPEDYILQKSDLPDRYVLKPNGSTPHLNSEVVGARGVEEGNAYLEATGRLGGWIIWYQRADSKTLAPDWIESYVVMYDRLDGPTIALSDKWDFESYGERLKRGEIIPADPPVELGDFSRAYYSRTRQASGKYFLQYTLEFTYRNVLHTIYGEGLESNVQPEYMKVLAEIALEKLKAAPLK